MKDEKRMIGNTNYEVRDAIQLGDKEIILAENMNEPDGLFYMVCNYKSNGWIGEFSEAVAGDNYLEIMQTFLNRLGQQIESRQMEIAEADYQADIITADQCHPHDYGQSIEGKVVAIKARVLLPEYRRGDNQLVRVSHGNGTKANPYGSAVFCYHLNTGEFTRFERQDVLGEIKILPEWAKERITAMNIERQNKSREAR